MNLIFDVPIARDRVFLVDSLPFQEGTFRIELPYADEPRFYLAASWKKVNDKANPPQ